MLSFVTVLFLTRYEDTKKGRDTAHQLYSFGIKLENTNVANTKWERASSLELIQRQRHKIYMQYVWKKLPRTKGALNHKSCQTWQRTLQLCILNIRMIYQINLIITTEHKVLVWIDKLKRYIQFLPRGGQRLERFEYYFFQKNSMINNWKFNISFTNTLK